MIIEDLYFIGRNQTEIFCISFGQNVGILGGKFGICKDNSFQKDDDLKDRYQVDLLPVLGLPGGLLSAGPGWFGSSTSNWDDWDHSWGFVNHLVDYLFLHGLGESVALDLELIHRSQTFFYIFTLSSHSMHIKYCTFFSYNMLRIFQFCFFSSS